MRYLIAALELGRARRDPFLVANQTPTIGAASSGAVELAGALELAHESKDAEL